MSDLEKLTPVGFVLHRLSAAFNAVDDALDDLRAAKPPLIDELDDGNNEYEVTKLCDAALALMTQIERVQKRIEHDYPEPVDADTVGDAQYHAAKDEGLVR